MRRIIPGLLALLWAAAAWAGSSSLEFGPPQPWVKPTPLPAAGTDTQADVKNLLFDYQVELTPQTIRYYFEGATHIQTPEGLSAAGNIAIVWDPDTDVVTVHKVQILRGDKVIDVLGTGQTFTIARRETNLDLETLDDALTAILQPAGLQVGDTVDIAYTLERSDPILAGTLEAEIEIPPDLAVTQLHVSAQWPVGDRVQWRATEGLSGVLETHADGMKGVALTMSDLQPILQPKNAPPRFLVRRRIELSGLRSWSEVAQRLSPLYQQATKLQASSLLQAQIASIAAATTDPKKRAALALALVEDQIRYLLLAMNNGGLVPATADQTWSRRYGDCKAKTVLLLALLHGLGMEARPVAVSVIDGDGLDQRLPSIAAFDHVLVQATIDDQPYWLDGTRLGDRSLDLLHVPYYHWGLPLVSMSPGLVRMIPAPLFTPSLETSVSIDAGAGVSQPAPFHAEVAFHDYPGVLMRQRLGNLSAAQLDSGLRELWSKQYSYVTVHAVAASYDEKNQVERLSMDGTARMDWGENEYMPPGLTLGYDADFERKTGLHKDAPFAVAYPTYSSSTVTIKLPLAGQGFSITGGDVIKELAGFDYSRQARIDSGVFTAVASARSMQPEFPAAEAPADQKALRELTKTELEVHAPVGHSPTGAEIAWGLPSYNVTAADYVKSASMLAERREYDAAIADCDAALALDSRNVSALTDRAEAYQSQGDDGRARSDYAAALAIDPHNSGVLDGTGWLAMSSGDSTAAISAFTGAIASNPKDAYAVGNRAMVYLWLGKNDEALADLNQAVRLNPLMLNLYWMRAVILKQQGRMDEASRQARLAIAVAPTGYQPYFLAGEIYMALGEQAKATAAFDRGATMAPTYATYLERAQVRPWTDLAQRRADIESALKLNASFAPALAMLAEVQLTAGQYSEAIASLTSAMRNSQDVPGVLTLRGIAAEKDGQTALANEDFTNALKRARFPVELSNICWELATHQVSLDSARDDCNTAITKQPRNPLFLERRGFVLLRLAQYDKAIADYDGALRSDPLLPNALYGRGICELRQGKTEQAHADIRAATVLSYEVADEFAHYGVRP